MNLQKYCYGKWKNINSADQLTIVLLAIYLIALCWILLFKLGVRFSYIENRKVNLIPFNDYFIANGRVDVAEIVMNVAIFVPLGVYVAILLKQWNSRQSILFCLSISLMIEGLQFILKLGAFDITDLITNTLGGFIGLILFKILEKVLGSSVKAQKFTNTIAAIGTAIMSLFLLLLKTNNLWIKYQ
jgi:glycopeptide antibiotics resistance protein